MRDLLARNPRYFQASPDAENFTSKLAAKVDRHPGRTFAVLTIAYLLVAFTLSSFKLLWLDELITLHIARLSGLGTIWRALTQGADPNPPVTYVLVHWSRQLFGDHEFAYRIPAICGYWIGIASLYFYLRRHLTGSWAIFGCIVSMSMGAFNYSFESRSYALLYGLAMLAFFCWTVHANARHAPATRWAGLIGMVVALAAGISTNYFSVLAFLPPAVGELVLTILRMRGKFGAAIQLVRLERLRGSLSLRGIDLRVWLGFAIAAAPLLAYKPLIEHSIAQFAPYAWNRVSLNQVFDSYTEMVEVILYPILGIFLAGVVVLFTRERVFAICEECRSGFLPEWAEGIYAHSRARLSIPVHEAAGVFVFLCYPICGYIVASIRGGMLSPRFVIPVCFGFAIAAAMVTHYLFHNVRHAATVALCIACGWFLCRDAVVGYWYSEQKQSFYNVINGLQRADAQMPANSPIVIPDPLLALTFHHYAPDSLAAREVFPVDFPAIRHYRRDDSPEENLWAGRKLLYRVPILTMGQFQSSAGPYLIVANPGNWLLKDLRAHRYKFSRFPINTRARAIGGFTPLARGTPAIFRTQGDRAPATVQHCLPPASFAAAENRPEAKRYVPPELLNDE